MKVAKLALLSSLIILPHQESKSMVLITSALYCLGKAMMGAEVAAKTAGGAALSVASTVADTAVVGAGTGVMATIAGAKVGSTLGMDDKEVDQVIEGFQLVLTAPVVAVFAASNAALSVMAKGAYCALLNTAHATGAIAGPGLALAGQTAHATGAIAGPGLALAGHTAGAALTTAGHFAAPALKAAGHATCTSLTAAGHGFGHVATIMNNTLGNAIHTGYIAGAKVMSGALHTASSALGAATWSALFLSKKMVILAAMTATTVAGIAVWWYAQTPVGSSVMYAMSCMSIASWYCHSRGVDPKYRTLMVCTAAATGLVIGAYLNGLWGVGGFKIPEDTDNVLAVGATAAAYYSAQSIKQKAGL
jgi:hypothetical protein